MIEGESGRRRRGRRRGDLTVTTIAELAGVSPPTVSKVLNGRGGVGESTRQRVEALLRVHGYRRPAASQPANTVEVVFFGMLRSIAVEIMRGVEEVVSDRDMTVGFTDLQRSVTDGKTWVESLLLRRPTGVIFVSAGLTTEHRETLRANGVPMVAVDPTGDMHRTPWVGSNNWSSGLDATRHLIELGHRRIGVITGPMAYLPARARFDGFRAALDTAGVPLDERLVRHGCHVFEQGRDLGLELLALPDRPTAIVCGDDLQALGVYEAARRVGLRIPDDLSVVGFDDIEHCVWCWPPMTTIRQPFAEMGATAARLVLALAAGETLGSVRYELATTLVVRGSTAPPGPR